RATLGPSGVDLEGRPGALLRAHAVIMERSVSLPAVQTSDPGSQELERRIRREWTKLGREPEAPRPETRTLARDLTALDCPYEDWETVYRQVLQLHLAQTGAEQLLASAVPRARLRKAVSRRRFSERAFRSAGEAAVAARRNALAGTADSIATLLKNLGAG